jgi:phosphoribosylamine--glycine ligase
MMNVPGLNILVIGSGGREHAVTKSLAQSSFVKKIFCSPANAGILQLAEALHLDIKNHAKVIEACTQLKIDLVFIGPEDPLVDGLSDSLRDAGFFVFGPSKQAAQLEGSKIFAKEFMKEAKVPTADADIVTSVNETMSLAKKYSAPYILKADGLAAGKGVFICSTLEELKTSAENLFEKKLLGDAGCRALLEQNLPGKEISFLVLTNGSEFQALPLAQDHKRLMDHNKGPNTGGMGTVAPMFIEPDLYQKIIHQIVEPSIKNLKKRDYLFRGVLFIGLMIVNNQPYVLEYNVRFGDPETQVILPLIKNDISQLFLDLSHGELQKIEFHNKTAFCIVNAAEGYPDNSTKNTLIELPDNTETSYVLHAGTALNSQNKLVSNGGRVLNVVAISDNFTKAQEAAYALNSKISFNGRQFRTDIGNYT